MVRTPRLLWITVLGANKESLGTDNAFFSVGECFLADDDRVNAGHSLFVLNAGMKAAVFLQNQKPEKGRLCLTACVPILRAFAYTQAPFFRTWPRARFPARCAADDWFQAILALLLSWKLPPGAHNS